MRTPWHAARLPRKLGSGGPYFAMILMNAIGWGLFTPFSVLYFHQVVGLSLPLVGLGLSIAAGAGLVATPPGGLLIDRFGARPVAIVSNLVSAAGFVAYLSVHSFAGFLTVALFLAIGSNGGGAANPALVMDLAAAEDRDRWYALMRMISNAGSGAGALLAGVLVAGGGTAGYQWMVGLNALSFVLAAGLLLLVRVQRTPVAKQAQSGTYRTVLRDYPFLGLVGASALVLVGNGALVVALPPYLILPVHAPAWMVGLLFALNAGMIVVLQMPLVHVLASWRRTRILGASGLGYGLSFLLLAAAPLLPPNLLPWYLCGCMMLYTLAEIVSIPTLIALAAALVPTGMQGRYLAIFQLAPVTAATITPTLSESLLTASPQGFWLLLAALMVGAAALLYWLEQRLPEAALRATREAGTIPSEYEASVPACAEVSPAGPRSLETRSAE
jgi:MFS family permease